MGLRIGHIADNYPERRNIIGVLPEAQYVDLGLRNLSLIREKIQTRLRNMLSSGVERSIGGNNYVFRESARNRRVDLLHFFNTISYGPTPWVTTFETTVPRFHQTRDRHHGRSPGYADLADDKEIAEALKALADPACLGLIAISECSRKIQLDLLDIAPKLRDQVAAKLEVIKPPQRALTTFEAKEPLYRDEKLRLLFVGSSFHRKGGMEMLEALVRPEWRGKVDLTIVSNIQIDNYARRETQEEVNAARRMIQENRSWITHHEYLPNDQVLALMQRAHVGLLPTWADTYGYVVLEFQANGCPVITTDVRALPEMNDAASGWLVPVPKNRLGEAIYSTEAERGRVQRAIVDGLGHVFEEMLRDRAGLIGRSRNSLERIKRDHSPEGHAERLRTIYARAGHQ